MTTVLNFKPGLDIPQWRLNAPAANGINSSIALFAYDMRNDATRTPIIYRSYVQTGFDCYNPVSDEWITLASPGLSAWAVGVTAIMHPSQGPRGTITTGATTTSVVLSTALPSAVGINQLADRGDGTGFVIRIIGNSSGGSGIVNERFITANTSGTTPTITVSAAFDFTPASGDTYELLSGRVFLLGSGASPTFKYYDIATNSYSSALSNTNLPTIATDSSMVALSELHVSNDRAPGSGFIGAVAYDTSGANAGKLGLACTAVANGSITLTGAPANLAANEYRNFQVRVVKDATNPTAAGQRRLISSHTSGASAVLTLGANWAVNPSTSAIVVVENNDNLIVMRSSATTAMYNYAIATQSGGTANTWDASTTFGAAGNAVGAGVVFEQAFGITRDPSGNVRQSFLYCVRGGGSNAIDYLDIAAASAGTWTNGITYGNQNTTFTTGTCGALDPATLGGKYLHLNVNGTQRMARFNMLTQTMEAGTYMRFLPNNLLVSTGCRLAFNYLIDGSTKLAMLHQHLPAASGVQVMSMAVQF